MQSDRRGLLHGVPVQKPNFLARDELEVLRQALLTSAAVGITSVGLHGMSGIGKTVLAVALCHEDAVRSAFPDGIFWLSLGQEPDILRLLNELAALAGHPSAFASIALAQEALRRHFADRTSLLIIDDLWRLADARDLAVLGPRGRTLITTRDASLLTALAAKEVPLDVLSPPVALHLLALWSRHVEPLPPAAEAVSAAGCRSRSPSPEPACMTVRRGQTC